MDLNTDELIRVALDAIMTSEAELPTGLRSGVLAAAGTSPRSRIDAGWMEPVSTDLSAQSAFLRTAAELADLLGGLGEGEWERPTRVAGRRVRDLVVHLVGVERYVLGQLGWAPAVAAPRREDHYPVSMTAASDLAAARGAQLPRAWWLAVMAVIRACGELGPDHQVEYHDLPGTVRGLLVVRTFELWTHGDDIRHATERRPDVLDEARLGLMSGELMRVLPLGMAMTGTAQPGRTARIDLTGPGGGSRDVALAPGEHPGTPDIVVRARTIDLCRLAANRLARADFDCVVDGDETLLRPILVGAGAFAAD
jgi:uncharacterized protein (TIGR03083 family)